MNWQDAVSQFAMLARRPETQLRPAERRYWCSFAISLGQDHASLKMGHYRTGSGSDRMLTFKFEFMIRLLPLPVL